MHCTAVGICTRVHSLFVPTYLFGRCMVSSTASLITHNSLPSMFGTAGVPPVAIKMNLDCIHTCLSQCSVSMHGRGRGGGGGAGGKWWGQWEGHERGVEGAKGQLTSKWGEFSNT